MYITTLFIILYLSLGWVIQGIFLKEDDWLPWRSPIRLTLAVFWGFILWVIGVYCLIVVTTRTAAWVCRLAEYLWSGPGALQYNPIYCVYAWWKMRKMPKQEEEAPCSSPQSSD